MAAVDHVEQNFVKSDLKIPTKTSGWDLDTWKYLPKASGRVQTDLPVIVMAHGISANKLMKLAVYAEGFASLGYAVVVFDYRRWGTSGGVPRHVVRVAEQLDDYRTVIKWCRRQPEFDPQRVILWGTSFSGGHAVKLASEGELNVKTAIVQSPYLGNSPQPPLTWAFVKTLLAAIQDALRQSIGLSPKYVPAIARPGHVGLLTSPGSFDFMVELINEGTYPNQISASSFFEFPSYVPGATGASITCPVILISGEQDSICPIGEAEKLRLLSKKVELVSFPCGHFDLYPGGPMHDKSWNTMKTFLLEHVPPTCSS